MYVTYDNVESVYTYPKQSNPIYLGGHFHILVDFTKFKLFMISTHINSDNLQTIIPKSKSNFKSQKQYIFNSKKIYHYKYTCVKIKYN